MNQDFERAARTQFVNASDLRHLGQADLLEGLQFSRFWWTFATHDIKKRYRRSVIGPFWMTLSTGIMIGALGLVFSQVFRQDLSDFLPYLAVGLIFWGFISAVILEGCTSFINAEGLIRNVSIPLSAHYFRMVASNMIILAHNLIIYALVWIIFVRSLNWSYLAIVPGFLLLVAIIVSAGLVAALLSARYRDLPQIIASMLQVLFFVTPIFWSKALLPERAYFVDWNPAFHLIELVRAPLLGTLPSPLSWLTGIGLLAVAIVSAFLLYRRTWSRVPHWV